MDEDLDLGFEAEVEGIPEEDFDIDDRELPLTRDKRNNEAFLEIQVDDITPIITENCIGAWDADTVIFRACSAQQTSRIKVTLKSDPSVSFEFENVTAFKGRSKKGITAGSWLHAENVKREVDGQKPWAVEDFEIEDIYELKGKHEDCVKYAQKAVISKINTVKFQYRIPFVRLLLGEGRCFRHDLELVELYKGQRKAEARPIILNEVREWAVRELGAEVARDGIEADDLAEWYGAKGYMHYAKTGKFNYVVIAADKDAKNNPKLLVDPDVYNSNSSASKKGKFKFPKAMLIESADKSAGGIEAVAGKNGVHYKFYGFKGLLWQAFLVGDGADHYSCLSHLGSQLGDNSIGMGAEGAYRLLQPCKTSKEALQAVVGLMIERLPYGVQYTSHKGIQFDVDTLTYLEEYWKVAYMTKKDGDKTSLKAVAKHFGVDLSDLIGNNRYTAPVLTFIPESAETVAKQIKAKLDTIAGEFSGYSSLKKPELVDKLKGLKVEVDEVIAMFNNFYELRQELKEQFKDEKTD